MARYILLTFLLISLFCMYQAHPMPQSEVENDFEKALKDTWNKLKSSIENGVNTIVENDTVQRIVEGGREILRKSEDAIRKEAEKIIPGTNTE